jgi:hypothetical protein
MHYNLLKLAFVSCYLRYYKSIYKGWISNKTRGFSINFYILFRSADKVAYLINIKCFLLKKAKNIYYNIS